MITDNTTPGRVLAAEGSYVDWAAILAGSVFALALSFLLLGFGASVGLSQTSVYRGEGMSASWLAIAAGVWLVCVMVTSFGAGGYLVGRMRRRSGDASGDEVATRDGAHGLMVWATGALVSALMAGAGAGGAVSLGSSAVGTAVSAATEAASSDYFANLMLRNTPQQPAIGGIGQPVQTASGVEPAVQKEIAAIIGRSATNGDMAERDRAYLAQLVAANSDLDPAAARARVDEITAEIDAARVAAMSAVEKARVAGVIVGFIAAATLLVGALAAFFAAGVGGRHRDDGLDFVASRR